MSPALLFKSGMRCDPIGFLSLDSDLTQERGSSYVTSDVSSVTGQELLESVLEISRTGLKFADTFPTSHKLGVFLLRH